MFICSAQFEDESLNKHFLQGPDLTNNLSGVLYRFRREPVAIMCEIESMFYQVKVAEEGRDLLRLLWWDEGDQKSQKSQGAKRAKGAKGVSNDSSFIRSSVIA